MAVTAKDRVVKVVYLKDRLGSRGRFTRRRGMDELLPRHEAAELERAGIVRIVAETSMVEPAEVKTVEEEITRSGAADFEDAAKAVDSEFAPRKLSRKEKKRAKRNEKV